MKKKIIIVGLNVLVVLAALSFLLNGTLVDQISSENLSIDVINIDVLEKVIKHLKILISIPALICVCISFILVILNKKATMYASIIFTFIAIILMMSNIITFENKVLSEGIDEDPVLSASTELVLYKIETDSYDSNGEYIENLIDIVS
ncbi:hypothetical protein R2F61_03885 [Mollicutes bacterium LVI A0078]|nr:hypothetical protein RZE84_03910 [Mollicutes bacterium LVI A0075]WOO91703.1 hypothetical protein R2F61_03885 [Mollicutes bacterium LVI A0078]